MIEQQNANMSDEQAQAILDEMREESPINGAMIDLVAFILYTQEAEGRISPQNALHMAQAAKQFVSLALAELDQLQNENMQLSNDLSALALAGAFGKQSGRA